MVGIFSNIPEILPSPELKIKATWKKLNASTLTLRYENITDNCPQSCPQISIVLKSPRPQISSSSNLRRPQISSSSNLLSSNLLEP